MNYNIQFKPQAQKDMNKLDIGVQNRVLKKLEKLSSGYLGDVKPLTNFEPRYRLRVGDYRVLFEMSGYTIEIYSILHRREAYR